jgi:drug/metabolite transporter (DMT)-like permease
MEEKIKNGENSIAVIIIVISIIIAITIIFLKTDIFSMNNILGKSFLIGFLIIGLFLIFRAILLWYWRINDIANSLINIAGSLNDIAISFKKILDDNEKEDKADSSSSKS